MSPLKNGIIIMSMAAALAMSSSAFAEDDLLEAYAKASEASGCGLIPFSNLQEHCTDEQENVNNICKNTSCTDLTKGKDRSEIETRWQWGERCYQSRDRVKGMFTEARNRIGGENNPEVNSKGKVIVERIVKEIDGHQRQLDSAFNAKATCNDKRGSGD